MTAYIDPRERAAAESVMLDRLHAANGAALGIIELTAAIPYSAIVAYEPNSLSAELAYARVAKHASAQVTSAILDEWVAAGRVTCRGGWNSPEGGTVTYALVEAPK